MSTVYAYPNDFTKAFSLKEVARAADRDQAPYHVAHEPELLLKGLDGAADWTDVDADVKAAALEAADRVREVLIAASRTIDAAIGARYELPLSTEAIEANDLKRTACELARYDLEDDGASERVTKDRDRRLAWLDGIRRGAIPLQNGQPRAGGPAATIGSPSALGATRYGQAASRYDWRSFDPWS